VLTRYRKVYRGNTGPGFVHPVVVIPSAKLRPPGHRIGAARLPDPRPQANLDMERKRGKKALSEDTEEVKE
jgi:hypothetical protein